MNINKSSRFDIIIGELLKEERIAKSMKQEDIADSLNMTRGAFSHYETGRRTMTLNTFSQIAKILELDANEFLKKAERRMKR